MPTHLSKCGGWRRWLVLLAVNAALLFIHLLALEGFCRWQGIPYTIEWTPSETALGKFDSELGWSYIPNLSKTVSDVGAPWAVYTDGNGIRTAAPGKQVDPSQPSIVFVGCSFTMGHGLHFRDSFVGQFSALPNVRLQAVNLGVQAYGTDQSLLLLRKFLPKFQAKIVVYTFMGEHVQRNGNYDRRLLFPTANFLGTKPLFALNDDGELYVAKSALRYSEYHCSYLWDALKIKAGTHLGLFPPSPRELTRALILAMKRDSEEAGAAFVVLNWRWTPEDDDGLFEALDVRVVDTLKEAPSNWSGMRMWENGGHPNVAASAHVAQLLYDYLHNNDLL